jgi:hypothetical protein
MFLHLCRIPQVCEVHLCSLQHFGSSLAAGTAWNNTARNRTCWCNCSIYVRKAWYVMLSVIYGLETMQRRSFSRRMG